MTEVRGAPAEHPSPHRERNRLEWLLAALAAGPTGWILQLVIGYGVTSHACRPGDAPLRGAVLGGWGAERLGLLALNLACMILILSGGALALAAWRRTRGEPAGAGRTGFLAACGVLVAAAFALATLFDTAWPFFIPPCWRFT